MDEQVIYKDRLIVITLHLISSRTTISQGPRKKRVPFEKVNSVAVGHASPSTGVEILGDPRFNTWYLLYILRPKRDEIFLMSVVGKKVRIGFTTDILILCGTSSKKKRYAIKQPPRRF